MGAKERIKKLANGINFGNGYMKRHSGYHGLTKR